MKLLILGANGLLGNTISKYFFEREEFKTFATLRDYSKIKLFNKKYHHKFLIIENILDFDQIKGTLNRVRPDILINCLGVSNKEILNNFNQAEKFITINSLLPHKLYEICNNYKIRLIHLSSDCVFSGKKGSYSENNLPDPKCLYGRSKLLGEVNYKNSITIRKSVIGHEIDSKNGLLEWFLSQKDEVQGYKDAIFSGMTVLELATLIEKYIIPNEQLGGVLHVSGESITKYDLLKIISSIYNKSIHIRLNKSIKVDRSLNSTKFNQLTGYKIKPWPILIRSMYEFNQLSK